jgi:hypothetical protein
MRRESQTILILASLLLFVFSIPSQLSSATLPLSTQEMLRRLKLDPGILSGTDRELEAPREWLEKAKKEGRLTVPSSSKSTQLKTSFGPFKERYPFLAVEQQSARARTVRSKPWWPSRVEGTLRMSS